MPARGGKWRGSKWIRRTRRLAIYARDERRCVWCGNAAALLCLDHLHPAEGNGSGNLVTSCFGCNNSRGNLPISTWLDRLAARGVKGAEDRLWRARLTPIDLAAGRALLDDEELARGSRSASASLRRQGIHLPEGSSARADVPYEEIPF